MTTTFNINLSASAPVFNVTLGDDVIFSVASAIPSAVAFGTTAGTAAEGNDSRLSNARQPLAHKSTHLISGSDRILPVEIGAQSLFEIGSVGWNSVSNNDPITLPASRAKRWLVNVYKAGNFDLILPTTEVQVGDIVELSTAGTWDNNATVAVKQQHSGFQTTLVTLMSGNRYRFENSNGSSSSWGIVNPHTHTHTSSQISDFVAAVTAAAPTPNLSSPPQIGNTTPNTGAFTTLVSNNGTITASAPALDVSQTWNNSSVAFTGMRIDCTATANSTSSSYFSILRSGAAQFAVIAENANTPRIDVGGSGFATRIRGRTAAGVGLNFDGIVGVGGTLQFGVGTTTGAGDVHVVREAADTLALLRSSNPQTLRIYGTHTDASNYERGFVRWSAAGGNFEIGTENLGTGSARHVTIRAGANSYSFFNNGEFSSPVSLRITNRLLINTVSNGVATLFNSNGNDFGRLQFGGTTSSFHALKLIVTVLQSRLDDDSDFAPIQGQLRTHQNAVSETITATHTLTLFDAAGTAYKVPCVAA